MTSEEVPLDWETKVELLEIELEALRKEIEKIRIKFYTYIEGEK